MNRYQNKIIIFVTVALLIGVILYFYLGEKDEPILITESFTYGLEQWIKDKDLPMDPNNPGYEVAWNITQFEDPKVPTNKVAKLYLDGSQDDGTIWIEREIELKANKEYKGTINIRLYSESESFNQLAAIVGYIGTQNPELEGDLFDLGPANQVKGWKNYQKNVIFNTDSKGTAWIACGISVRWETRLIYLIDDVKVEFN